MVVQKFGGSSVADADGIRIVIGIAAAARERGERPAVVVFGDGRRHRCTARDG